MCLIRINPKPQHTNSSVFIFGQCKCQNWNLLWLNWKSHFWHELILKCVSIGLCERKLFVMCFFPHNNFPLVQVDNSAQQFHHVYRHVFQLTCVLHLEPESTQLSSYMFSIHFKSFGFALIHSKGKRSQERNFRFYTIGSRGPFFAWWQVIQLQTKEQKNKVP